MICLIFFTTISFSRPKHEYNGCKFKRSLAKSQAIPMPAQTRTIVFCFAGQGYVPLEAARDLYRTSDAFRGAIHDVDAEITSLVEAEELERTFILVGDYFEETEMRPPHVAPFEADKNNDSTGLTTPAAPLVIFTAQYALARVIQNFGIEPTDVVGYSLGEHCASMVTGSLPLRAGLKLLLRREEMFNDRNLVPKEGGMLTIQAPAEQTKVGLARNGVAGVVDVSGYPHSKSSVLSGNAEDIEDVQKLLEDDGMECQRRKLPYGMHATHVKGVADELRRNQSIFSSEDSCDAKVKPGVRHWSNVSGTELPEGTPLNANYWATHLTTPIHFKHCVEGIYKASKGTEIIFLDLGMGPRLTRLVQNTLQETSEWGDGRVRAINCIVSTSVEEEVKAREGWALQTLMTSLDSMIVE